MQTLRRELRLKFKEVLTEHTGLLPGEVDTLTGLLADAAFEVDGYRRAATRGQKGDLMDGVLHFAGLAKERGEEIVEGILDELERGLHRNIPRTTEWQLLAHWIIVQERKGENYSDWVTWYMADEWRAGKEAWKLTPQQVKNSWPQAFPQVTKQERLPGGGFYG